MSQHIEARLRDHAKNTSADVNITIPAGDLWVLINLLDDARQERDLALAVVNAKPQAIEEATPVAHLKRGTVIWGGTGHVGQVRIEPVAATVGWSRSRVDIPLFAGPQPAYCCCKCGMPDLRTVPRGHDGIDGAQATDVIPVSAIAGDDDCSAIIPARGHRD